MTPPHVFASALPYRLHISAQSYCILCLFIYFPAVSAIAVFSVGIISSWEQNILNKAGLWRCHPQFCGFGHHFWPEDDSVTWCGCIIPLTGFIILAISSGNSLQSWNTWDMPRPRMVNCMGTEEETWLDAEDKDVVSTASVTGLISDYKIKLSCPYCCCSKSPMQCDILML